MLLLETELFSVRAKKYKCGHQISFLKIMIKFEL